MNLSKVPASAAGVLVLSLFTSLATAAAVPPRPSNGSGGPIGTYPSQTMVVNGTTRTYRLTVPTTLPAGAAVPLLLAFHGCCVDSPTQMAAYTGFDSIAAQQNFVVIYPEAIDEMWATSVTDASVDIAFVDALISFATSSYNIDLNRLYITGMSEGAIFGNIATAMRSGEIAAEAPHSGAMDDVAAEVALHQLVIDYKYGVNAVVGSEDMLLPPSDSESMIATYQSWGQPTLLTEIAGLGHSWGDTSVSNGIWNFLIDHPMQLVTAPPIISSVSATTTQTSATVSWTTSAPATSEVDYCSTLPYASTVTDSTLVTAHTESITGLGAGTIHHFRVQSTDGWGNQAASPDYTFTTAANNSLPVISSFLVSSSAIASGQSATLSWSTSNATSLSINQSVGAVTGLTSKVVTPSVTTTYTLTATNAGGSTTASITLTVNSGADEKPVGSFDPITGSGGITGWAQDPDNPGFPIYVNVYIDLNAGTVGAIPIPVLAAGYYSGEGYHGFTYVLPNVYRDNNPHQAWVWGVDLTDLSGASNTQLPGSPQTFTFTLTDNTPPVITGVAPTALSAYSASIGWTTNESATTQVQYGTTSAYGSLTTLNSTLSTSHIGVIVNLRPNITYHYSVISVDGSGNVATSPDATFVTP